MNLRVFFYRKFVVGQGRERSIAREFLEKMRKSKKKERASEGGCGKRKEHGSMESITPTVKGQSRGKKHLLCYIENVGANIVRPPTWCSKAFSGRPCT